MTRDEAYSLFFKDQHCPAYLEKWVLNSFCGSDFWDIVTVSLGGEIMGLWFYHMKTKLGMRYITMPSAVKYMGPILRDGLTPLEQNNTIQDLIANLPECNYIVQQVAPIHSSTDFLEHDTFSKSTSRDSYTISLQQSEQEFLGQMNANYRRSIQKNKASIEIVKSQVSSSTDIQDFIDLLSVNLGSLAKHNIQKEDLKNYINAAELQRQGKLLLLKTNGILIAGAILLWDEKQAYYLFAANNAEYKKQYPGVQMVWNTFQYLKKHTSATQIDLMGSSIEAIARVWVKLGAKKIGYQMLETEQSTLFRIATNIKNAFKGF